MERVKTQNLPT